MKTNQWEKPMKTIMKTVFFFESTWKTHMDIHENTWKTYQKHMNEKQRKQNHDKRCKNMENVDMKKNEKKQIIKNDIGKQLKTPSANS